MIHMTYVKITISGNVIDFVECEKLNIKNDMKKARETEKGNGSLSDENYARTMRNRATAIRQIINTNFTNKSKFLTLTFRPTDKFDVKDIKQCNHEFKKFIKRLNYNTNKKARYVAVIEFQDKNGRGAIHYHMIIDIPYVPFKKLKEIWGLGSIRINKIDSCDNVGAYVVKYMTKDINDERLKGIKAYNMSLNLGKPIVYKSWENQSLTKEMFEMLQENKKSLVYEKSYSNDKTGKIVHQQYNLTRNQ